MIPLLKRLGVYRALNASAVQFNSIVFRVVVGFLAGIPGQIVALVPAIEFTLNFLLDVPAGYLADKYGRIPFAIAGHVSVILGLVCAYLGLLGIANPEVSYFLFVLQGVFVGLMRPLNSGSVEAFYQDALIRQSRDAASDALVARSFTVSKAYGKHLTTIAVVAAFGSIYVFHSTMGAHHAFIPGIILWAVTLWKLIDDYRTLGDVKQTPSPVTRIIKTLVGKRRAFNSVLYSLSGFMLLGIVMGYFIVAVGREMSGSSQFLKWVTIVAFMLGSQGFGWIAKSYVLPPLINRMSERHYLTFFYLVLAIASSTLSYSFWLMPHWATIAVVFFYGAIFFMAYSAIQSVSQNMVMDEVEKKDYAMMLSVQNAPGLLFIGLYSLYLTLLRNGCPSVTEILISVAAISVFSLFCHLWLHQTSSAAVQEIPRAL